jgi:transcriptional regulator of NAD metabolism
MTERQSTVFGKSTDLALKIKEAKLINKVLANIESKKKIPDYYNNYNPEDRTKAILKQLFNIEGSNIHSYPICR